MDYPYPHLSAKYKGSYAYLTVKDRMPVILTKVIDFLCRKRKNFEISYGESSGEELKVIIGKLSKLRSEMQTNKPLQPLSFKDTSSLDYKIWNSPYFERNADGTYTWFNSPWLLVECHMYRAIWDAFEDSSSLKLLDPFAHLKIEAYENSKEIICSLATYTVQNSFLPVADSSELKKSFIKHIEAALWGNRNDLSVTGGDSEKQLSHVMDDMHRLQSNILVNNTKQVWQYLEQCKADADIGDLSIIMDNCGLEMMADLCLAVFLLTNGFFHRVFFYVKKIPWFVSDVTTSDFNSTLQTMKNDASSELRQLAERCLLHISLQQFQVVEESYWTSPLPYHVMEKEDYKLFETLKSNKLLIFKGDLNYRKLGADLSWPTTISFHTFLQGFQPAPLLSLRTVKAEIVCDLPLGKAEELKTQDECWMAHGDYGLVQFVK